MSRRKQAFPVRVEGDRLHLSTESASSCIPSETTSSKIVLNKRDSTPDDDIFDKPLNVLSGEECIVSSDISDEPKVSKLSCEESNNQKNVIRNEGKEHDVLPSVTVESSVVPEEDTVAAVTSPYCDSSSVKKEHFAFHVDVRKQTSSVVNAEPPKPVHQSHSCKEVGKNDDISRDVNVRTSLVCKAGTEIKIVVNTSAEKVEVQCVTNLTQNTFEIHKKPPKLIERSSTEDITLKTVEHVGTLQEELESKGTVLQDVLPCAEANDKKLKPLILSCMDSVPDVEESNISTSPIDERSHCVGDVSSPEPDSSTVLLDDCELNIQEESVCVGSSHILPDAELVLTGHISTDILADEEALPPLKVEPCIILKEEQEPLNIPSCIGSFGTVKDESFSSLPIDEEKQIADVINIPELEPPYLSDRQADSECEGVAKNCKTCNDLNSRSSVTRRITRQSVRAEREEAQGLAEFTKSTSKVAIKQLGETSASFNKDTFLNSKEQEHVCTGSKNILGSKGPLLEAVLPCVGIDLSVLKEQEPIISSSCKIPVSVQENASATFLGVGMVINSLELKQLPVGHGAAQCDHKGIESIVEECRELNVKTHAYGTRNRANQNNYAEVDDDDDDDDDDGVISCKGNTPKTGRKRRQKTKRSRRRIRAPQTKDQNQGYSEPEDSQLQAILPCVGLDPSLLKHETEPVTISSCKDPLFTLPGDEGKQSKSKANTPSEHMHVSCEELGGRTEVSEDSTSNLESHIPGNRLTRRAKPCVTDEEIQCMVDFTKEALEQREKKLQQIRDAVYRKRALETEEQRQARLEKDKLRQRKRRAEETEEQREKRLLTMRLHKRIKRSMNSASGLQKNFLDYYMEEMFKYPETQEEQGSPLNMIVSIDPSWVLRTVEKQQFKCAVETEEQRRIRLEKDMLRQRKKRAEETPDQRAKRLETMRINKRIRRAMETEEQRLRRLEYSRERQLFRRLNETEEQRKERLEREKLRQREKRAAESAEERALRLHAARERMRERLSDPSKVTDMIDNLLSSDSLSS